MADLRIGVDIGDRPTADIPADVGRFVPLEPPPFIWVTPPFIKALKAAGKDGLARLPWQTPAKWPLFGTWVRDWAQNVDCDWHEFGNEPRPEDWADHRKRLEAASSILRHQGRKVVLAAARTKYTREWLETTPDHTFEAVDAIALHPYFETPREVLEAVQEARALVPGDKPLIISEFGISCDSRGLKGNFPVIDPTGKTPEQIEVEQADYIEHTLRLLRQHAADLKLIIAVCFCLYVYDPEVEQRWAECGLIRTDGTKRPAFDVLAKRP